MTSLNEAREACYQRWQTQWASRTAFTFDREKYSEPDSDWVAFTVRQVNSSQETLGAVGNRKFWRSASVVLTVYGYLTQNEGQKNNDDHVQIARNIFEATTFSNLYFHNAQVRELGSDGKYNRTEVEIAFDYEEIK